MRPGLQVLCSGWLYSSSACAVNSYELACSHYWSWTKCQHFKGPAVFPGHSWVQFLQTRGVSGLERRLSGNLCVKRLLNV